MADEDDQKEYRWETGYEKTWEVIREDDEGLLASTVIDVIHRAKRKRLLERAEHVRLGMMRHVYVIIDFSEAMTDQDLKPTRQICTLKIMEKFIEEFFDQNPISQLGIITTKNKRAEKLTELSGNPKKHTVEVKKAVDVACAGEPSLQNALELALRTLKHLPAHVSREIVVIFGSLTTCDPGNIYSTIELLKQNNIRCSVVGLAAEVKVCRILCKETNGTYNVILDESHFKELLSEQINPPSATTNTESSLIRMGFPSHMMPGDKGGKPAMCMCHLDSKNPGEGFSSGGYFCPQCKSKYCDLPVECKACGLTLVSASHLARSYHHLFPLDQFEELNLAAVPAGTGCCFACQKIFTETKVYRCNHCNHSYCLDCDLFIHETLHSCPGCASAPKE